MAADGRVRVTLPVRYQVILQRHRGSMSDAGFIAWVLDNIDRGVLAIGVEPHSINLLGENADALQPVRPLPIVESSRQEDEDEFEDVI